MEISVGSTQGKYAINNAPMIVDVNHQGDKTCLQPLLKDITKTVKNCNHSITTQQTLHEKNDRNVAKLILTKGNRDFQ